jgi:hypothetical protein
MLRVYETKFMGRKNLKSLKKTLRSRLVLGENEEVSGISARIRVGHGKISTLRT